jgi:hypothetical protein
MNPDFVQYADFSDIDWIRRAFDSQGCDRFGHRNARYGDSEVPFNEESESRPRGVSILSVRFWPLKAASQGSCAIIFATDPKRAFTSGEYVQADIG